MTTLREIMVRRRVVLGAGLGIAGALTGTVAAVLGGRSDEDPASAAAPAELRVATGPPGAVYRQLGGPLVALLAARFPRSRVMEIQTDGTVDNLTLLSAGGAELAFAHLDATVGGLAAGRPRDVTAVARLYDAWMQVIVLESSPVRRFADLDGRAVTAGGAGSGTHFASGRLIDVAGIRPRIVDAVQADGAGLLATGRVDAWMTLTGIPTPAVTRLVRDHAVRMIPLAEYAETMTKRYGDIYAPATVPPSVYRGIADIETVTTPNVLLARPDLAASVIEEVTRTLFAKRAQIAQGHSGAIGINVRTAIATAPLRLHPGAVSYFRSSKT